MTFITLVKFYNTKVAGFGEPFVQLKILTIIMVISAHTQLLLHNTHSGHCNTVVMM